MTGKDNPRKISSGPTATMTSTSSNERSQVAKALPKEDTISHKKPTKKSSQSTSTAKAQTVDQMTQTESAATNASVNGSTQSTQTLEGTCPKEDVATLVDTPPASPVHGPMQLKLELPSDGGMSSPASRRDSGVSLDLPHNLPTPPSSPASRPRNGYQSPINSIPSDPDQARRFAFLTYEQVARLDSLMNTSLPIHGRGNYPTLDVKLRQLVTVVRKKLAEDSMTIRDIRLNGGAASHVLLAPGQSSASSCCSSSYRHCSSNRYQHQTSCSSSSSGVSSLASSPCSTPVPPSCPSPVPLCCPSDCYQASYPGCYHDRIHSADGQKYHHNESHGTYNDLDLIFTVDLSTPQHFDRIKAAVLDSLLDLLPEGVNKNRLNPGSLKDAYVHKMVKVTEGDRWSLISLSNNGGRNVELKFVDTMRRQFEFSVDSFQVVLDSLLLFYDYSEVPMSENFYPTVIGESVYGDFQVALSHLHQKLIATRNPEEIRGGGLLKYCNLLVRGYRAADLAEIKSLERYMCSRFFIDFPDVNQQQVKLDAYLANHFTSDEAMLMYNYLITLYEVVDDSTVCLMGHERRQTLALIDELACHTIVHEQDRLYKHSAHYSGAMYSSYHHQPSHHHQAQQVTTIIPANQPLMYYYTPYMAPGPLPCGMGIGASSHNTNPSTNGAANAPPGGPHYTCVTWMPCA